jgi:hypothetical protein
MKKFVFFLIVILSIVSCEPIDEVEPPRLGVVQGFTYIGSTNEPLRGLDVSLTNYNSQKTDSGGYFKFENVLEGDYTISVYQVLRLLSSKSISVKANNTTTVWFPFEYTEPQKKDLPDFSVVDISNESVVGWDYWIRGKNEHGKEECFYMNAVNYLPTSIVYHTFEDGKDYEITFNDKGLPKTIFANNALLFFNNFNGNKFDLGILSPFGEIQILRDIQTDFVWPTSSKSPQSRADAIRWAGTILGAVSCGASIAAAASTGGFATYLAIWTCGNFFLKTTSNFLEDANVENGFTNFVDKYKLSSTVYTCAINPTDPTQCLTALAQSGLNAYADYIEEMDVRAEYVNRLEILLANNVPPKNITFQPGPEGKDAHISLAGFSDPCREFYDHSGNDSIISVVHDSWSSCSVQVDEMLIQFSIGALIPATAVISSAQLELYGYATINLYNSSPTISVSELKSSWDEQNVSWENQPEGDLIGSIDFVSTSEYSWHSWDVTNVVQDWVSGRKENFGFKVSVANNYVWGEFYSGDNSDASKRPRLVVTYY